MASLRKSAATSDANSAKFLYSILKQLDLKSINWSLVAEEMTISNGHAARMRYTRFKQHIEGMVPSRKAPGKAASDGGGGSGSAAPATPAKRRARKQQARKKREKTAEEEEDAAAEEQGSGAATEERDIAEAKAEEEGTVVVKQEGGAGRGSLANIDPHLISTDGAYDGMFKVEPGSEGFDGVSDDSAAGVAPGMVFKMECDEDVDGAFNGAARGGGFIKQEVMDDEDGDYLPAEPV